jgi:hypothetical protein
MLRILKQSSHIQRGIQHVFFNKIWGSYAEFPQRGWLRLTACAPAPSETLLFFSFDVNQTKLNIHLI